MPISLSNVLTAVGVILAIPPCLIAIWALVRYRRQHQQPQTEHREMEPTRHTPDMTPSDSEPVVTANNPNPGEAGEPPLAVSEAEHEPLEQQTTQPAQE
jgi:hypothetical protein